METKEDLVSVIIPTCERYEQMLVAVYSVKNQTYKNIEIIVIDDGSRDIRYKKKIDNVTIINLEDKNSRKVLGFPSGGLVRNVGLKVARGKYIAFLDDDDYWLPNKLEIQVEYLKKYRHFLACCSDAYLCQNIIKNDENTNSLVEYNNEFWWKEISKKLNLTYSYPHKITKELLLKHNLIITSSVLFDSKLIDLVGYLPEYQNGTGTNGLFQDYEYWKKLIKHTKFYYFKTPLLIYYKNYKNKN